MQEQRAFFHHSYYASTIWIWKGRGEGGQVPSLPRKDASSPLLDVYVHGWDRYGGVNQPNGHQSTSYQSDVTTLVSMVTVTRPPHHISVVFSATPPDVVIPKRATLIFVPVPNVTSKMTQSVMGSWVK